MSIAYSYYDGFVNTIMFPLRTEQDSHRLALQKVGFASGLSYVQ